MILLKLASLAYVLVTGRFVYKSVKYNSKVPPHARYIEKIKPFNYDKVDFGIVKDKSIPILCGMTRTGIKAYDMLNYPHLLIVGETGSGKSTQIRSILTTIITRCKNIDLYLADLKRSEFFLFKDIAKSVDYDAVSLTSTLYKIKKEMIRRGELLNTYEVAHLADMPADKRPNYIIVAIDEVALLKKETDIMQMVDDISTIGRALGIFLILSMQRADRGIVEGTLKNNLTVRMAFKHADEINSRITIDSGKAGTISIEDKGNFYLKLAGLTECQSPYLDLNKAKKLLKPFKKPKGELKQEEVITDIEYEVIKEESDIMVFGGFDYVEDER